MVRPAYGVDHYSISDQWSNWSPHQTRGQLGGQFVWSAESIPCTLHDKDGAIQSSLGKFGESGRIRTPRRVKRKGQRQHGVGSDCSGGSDRHSGTCRPPTAYQCVGNQAAAFEFGHHGQPSVIEKGRSIGNSSTGNPPGLLNQAHGHSPSRQVSRQSG
jgi:hypothetical protein